MNEPSRRTVLITGASKGIGRATALRLDRAGWQVMAGVRSASDWEALRSAGSERLRPVELDVTVPEQIEEATRTIVELAPGGLHGLVNNAGAVMAGPLELLPVEQLRRQLEINVVGVVATTQACLPSIRSVRGRIVNVGSINGRLATPWSGAYCASKFALEALTDSWRMELGRWGIEVVLVEPGAVATPIWSTSRARAGRNLSELSPAAAELYGGLVKRLTEPMNGPPRRAIEPEVVAARIEQALASRRPRTRYLVGRDARLGALISLLPDRLRDRLLTRR